MKPTSEAATIAAHPSKRLIITAPSWHLSGVARLSERLAVGLKRRYGWDITLLMTQPDAEGDVLESHPELNIATLQHPSEDWRNRAHEVAAFVAASQPCVVMPNYDFDAAAGLTGAPRSVAILGVIHSDESVYYRALDHFGDGWDAVVGVSSFLGNHLKKLHPTWSNRIFAIPSGIEPQEHASRAETNPDHPLRILYAGRVAQEQKRVLDLVRIATALQQRGLNASFTVAGNGHDLERLKQKHRQHCPGIVFHFTGTLSDAEMAASYRQHDVFLLPSSYEGLPISLLEAMSHGLVPVVSNIRSGHPEVIQHGVNGFLCEPGAPDAFASTIETLHRNRSQLDTIARAARETVTQNFSLDRMVDAYANLLEELHERACNHQCLDRRLKNGTPPHHRRTTAVSRWFRNRLKNLRRRFDID